ncbi:CD209 antigen-like protein E isoform X3 [Scomber scombrus]|uniref:CD209 antigen-like protein E isoform X3 n=1 Tax=Scomber scombrus TaxID=13677 RepID=A0AAV1PA23_SCOSC
MGNGDDEDREKTDDNDMERSDDEGSRNSERRFHGGVVLGLGLLSGFLLAGLIGLSVYYYYSSQHSAEELIAIKARLTEERDLLNASVIEMKKQDMLKRTCPPGWMMFSDACYFLSCECGSWEKGKQDCTDRGASLVVINSTEEQKFLSNFTKEETMAWIGLTDRDTEGTWKWIDGSPLSLKFWVSTQPDDGGSKTVEEDCAHIFTQKNYEENWNDLPCATKQKWICEKMV